MLPQDLLPPRTQAFESSTENSAGGSNKPPRREQRVDTHQEVPSKKTRGDPEHSEVLTNNVFSTRTSANAVRSRSKPNILRPKNGQIACTSPMLGTPPQSFGVREAPLLPVPSEVAPHGARNPTRPAFSNPTSVPTRYSSGDCYDARRPNSEALDSTSYESTSAGPSILDSSTVPSHAPPPITAVVPHGSSHLVLSGSAVWRPPPVYSRISQSSAASKAGPSTQGRVLQQNASHSMSTSMAAGYMPAARATYNPQTSEPSVHGFAFPQNVQHSKPFRAENRPLPLLGPRYNIPPRNSIQGLASSQNGQYPMLSRTAAGILPPTAPPHITSVNRPSIQHGIAHPQSFQHGMPISTVAGSVPPAPSSFGPPEDAPSTQAIPQYVYNPMTINAVAGNLTPPVAPYIPLLKIAELPSRQSPDRTRDVTETSGSNRRRKEPASKPASKKTHSTVTKRTRRPKVPSSKTPTENSDAERGDTQPLKEESAMQPTVSALRRGLPSCPPGLAQTSTLAQSADIKPIEPRVFCSLAETAYYIVSSILILNRTA